MVVGNEKRGHKTMSMIQKLVFLAGGFAFGFTTILSAHADQVTMQNGERYVGKVVTLTNETVVVQSEVLGILKVPRSKIASITFGTNLVAAATQAPVVATAQPTRPLSATSGPDLTTAIQQLRADPNAMRQVEQQFLAGADPQAKEMFNQTMGGLMNGTLNLDDIRRQAKSAADQLRSAKKELGDDAGFAVDGYLAILDSFLRETATGASATTNAVAPPPKLKRSQAPEDE
jgi:hypothetical protein